MLKPPLSLFSHSQQPFPHLDPLPPLGPPPMGPTPGLCPGPPPNLGPPLGPAPAMGSPLTSAPALGPPVSLCPPPGHALVPPPLAPNSQMPPPLHLPPHFPPTPCREPTPSLPNVPPGLAPTPVSAQAAPEAEQPHGESSSMGSEEQDDTLGLDELCKPLYCKLCNVTLNSTQQAQAHYQGKNHSKKLRNFYAGREQPPAIRITDSDTSAQSNTGEGDTTRQLVFKGAARVILATENDYCKLCDASFSSVAVAQAHYQGKNHAKRLRLQEAHNNSESSSEVMPKRSRKEDYRLLKHRPQLPSPLTGTTAPSSPHP
uniref:U1-type domain-containing protein n=1 Tax=Knipowitschia caucasica TaxID=637954 RepID=A0AAV2L170_KNICA